MASRLQDVIQRGLAAARPLATAVAPGTLYFSTDTSVTERSNGTTWESYTDTASGGTPAGHHVTHESGGTDVVTLAQSQVTNLTTDLAAKASSTDPRFTDARTPTVHAASHASAGSDPLNVTSLAGFPGGTTNFLRADNTFAAPSVSSTLTGSIGLTIDGGASVITTGVKGYVEIPFACTIQAVTLLANVSGSIVIDIWKDTYVNYPPVVGDTIVASAKPTISSAIKSKDTTLTGWNTAIAAGDILGFNVDSVTTITKVILQLKIGA